GVDWIEVAADEKIISVARFAEDIGHCQRRARAGLVLDNNRHTEARRKTIRDESCRDVGRAAGGEPNDKTDRAIGIVRCRRRSWCQSWSDGHAKQQAKQKSRPAACRHDVPLLDLALTSIRALPRHFRGRTIFSTAAPYLPRWCATSSAS